MGGSKVYSVNVWISYNRIYKVIPTSDERREAEGRVAAFGRGAALRWASEDALLLYKRTQPGTYGGWLLGAERVRLTARMTHHQPRPMPRVDADDFAAAMINGTTGQLNADVAAAAEQADRTVDVRVTRRAAAAAAREAAA